MTYGCIGEHLPHSFSKLIHEKIGGYSYELKELAPEELGDFLRARDFCGINVTIPYKEAVIPYLDELDEGARAIGAVNTIVNRSGRLIGYNTDFAGLSALIRRAGLSVGGKKALILGTGGTSKTARAVLEHEGASVILRVSRNSGEGRISYEEAYSGHTDAEILVNTTPVGMFPSLSGCPLDLSRFPRLTGVIDAVYNPLRTRLVLAAAERGIPASGGLYMLVAQAVFAAEHFQKTRCESGLIERIFRELSAEKENIVLTGMPGCGKTTVGKIVAEATGRRFVDTDAEIVGRCGRPIPEIFAEEGEEAFRNYESEVLLDLAPQSGLVIATGGGALLRPENRTALRQNGKLYFLDRPLEKLLPTADRPLSSDRESLKRRYRERYALYYTSADEVIEAGGSAESAAEEILRRHTNAENERTSMRKIPHILVVNGPNLNLLGIREPAVYGRTTYADLIEKIRAHAALRRISVEIFQSNHEGELVDKIQEALGRADGIVLNPGAYTHTSVALLDALKAVSVPAVEVHISKVDEREPFRLVSYVRAACRKTISGRGLDGYLEAIDFLLDGRGAPLAGDPAEAESSRNGGKT